MAYSTSLTEGQFSIRSCSRRSVVVIRCLAISFTLSRPFSMSMAGRPEMNTLKPSLFVVRKDIKTCRNISMAMAITPFISEASGESMGIAASSAIIKAMTI